MADTGHIFIEPIIIITEPKLAKVIASVAIILRASLELATIRAGDFGAGGGTRSSGRVVYRTAGCGVEGGRAGSYPQQPQNGGFRQLASHTPSEGSYLPVQLGIHVVKVLKSYFNLIDS